MNRSYRPRYFYFKSTFLKAKPGDAVTTGGGSTATPSSSAPTATTTASTSRSGMGSGY